MKYRDLSKFQIRAEITLMLQKLDSAEELSREQQLKYIHKLSSIRNNDYVMEVLAKELGKSNYQKAQMLSLLIQAMATLEQVDDILWSHIKTPGISDEIKDIAGMTLKNLGDNTDPEEFLAYLENPRDIVDKETKKLLEIASINPEAQIDFLDFLFSLPENEQINLIRSLQEDYSSENIVNVIAPVLESRLAPHMDEYLIDIIGETRSQEAVSVLENILEYSDEEKIQKKAGISLKKLKLSGVNEKKDQISAISDIHECHITIPDGMGNQALIISRKKPNSDILLMNIVINEVHGILDCFGFYGISRDDFNRIIQKFQEKTTRFVAIPEFCRYLLEQAEKINKANRQPIPYEYISWKSIIKDIPQADYDFDRITGEWADEKYLSESMLLHKFPDFEAWFFEDDDHPAIQENIEKIVGNIRENKDLYLKKPAKLEKFIESEVNRLLPVIFDRDVRKQYKKRLQNLAILFNIEELEHFRNIAASLAGAMSPESGFDITNEPFARKIIEKTIIEGLLRHQYNIDNLEQQDANLWNLRKKCSKSSSKKQDYYKEQNIKEIIDILYDGKESSRA